MVRVASVTRSELFEKLIRQVTICQIYDLTKVLHKPYREQDLLYERNETLFREFYCLANTMKNFMNTVRHCYASS